jgi:hypothetical protein
LTPDQLLRYLVDPTAPLPTNWPGGVLGVFLLFCMPPLSGGLPMGVLMSRDMGLSPLTTAGVYLLSDLLLAITNEPILTLLRWLSKRIEVLARVGRAFGRLTGSAGLQEGGLRGPLGLILISFMISLTSGRAAAAASGHGFFSGWTLAIIGDMAYFGLLMVTTLWVSSIFGDDRLTIGAVLIATWVLPLVIRRLRQRSTRSSPAPAAPVRAVSVPSAPAVTASAPSVPRKRTHTGRRRPSRGLHR